MSEIKNLLFNYKEKNEMFSFGISEVRGLSTFTTLPSFYLCLVHTLHQGLEFFV